MKEVTLFRLSSNSISLSPSATPFLDRISQRADRISKRSLRLFGEVVMSTVMNSAAAKRYANKCSTCDANDSPLEQLLLYEHESDMRTPTTRREIGPASRLMMSQARRCTTI